MAARIEIEHVRHWLGSDDTLEQALEVIMWISNGEYEVEQLRQNIADYNELGD